MIEKINALALVLERMHVLYSRALDLLDRERQLLIRLEYELLFETLREKDEILSALRGLDKDRLRLQDQISMKARQDFGGASLKEIAEYLGSQDAILKDGSVRLLRLREKLTKTLAELTAKVDRNRTFTENSIVSLRRVAEHMNSQLQGRVAPQGKKSRTYSDKAKIAAPHVASGQLIEKRY